MLPLSVVAVSVNAVPLFGAVVVVAVGAIGIGSIHVALVLGHSCFFGIESFMPLAYSPCYPVGSAATCLPTLLLSRVARLTRPRLSKRKLFPRGQLLLHDARIAT